MPFWLLKCYFPVGLEVFVKLFTYSWTVEAYWQLICIHGGWGAVLGSAPLMNIALSRFAESTGPSPGQVKIALWQAKWSLILSRTALVITCILFLGVLLISERCPEVCLAPCIIFFWKILSLSTRYMYVILWLIFASMCCCRWNFRWLTTVIPLALSQLFCS